MGLEADTVDLHTGILDELHNTTSAFGFGTVVLEVIVVVVQLRVWVDLGRELEGQNQEFLADGVVPDGFAVSSVLLEGLCSRQRVSFTWVEWILHTFIDYVPAGAAALVAAGKTLNMVVHDFDELRLAEVAIGHPVRKLAVPDQIVAVNLDAMRCGIVDISVGIRKLSQESTRQHRVRTMLF